MRSLNYDLDDRPPLAEALPLGLQHLVAMLLGNITPPLLIAGALGVSAADRALLIQLVLFMAGLATLVQAYPLGPVGGRIPMVMGTSVAFVGGLVAVGRAHGLPTVFGACLAAAVVEVILGFSIERLKRWFPPLVNGIVLMLIGLNLIPVGMDFMAGGKGATDYGTISNLAIAALVAGVVVVLHQWGRGFWSYGSLLLGVAAGYGVALSLGKVDFAPLATASWVSIPTPLTFGLEFHWPSIFLVACLYVISAMETLGDIAGTFAAVGRKASHRELRGGLVADGVMSGLAALWSAFPNTSYSQNVGLVSFTGVASRHVTAVTGGLLVVLGILPKAGALFATIPPPVIGGGGLIMFGMIFASGAIILHQGAPWNQRTLVILALSIGLGLGAELRPDALAALPPAVHGFFTSSLVTGGLTALLLNRLLPESRES
ncbi:MAG: nucleobase:cation symporter-2 family protein [Acidobacteriota bacterium]